MIKPLENVELAPFTTLRIGGPARYLVEVKTTAGLINAVKWARKRKLPVTVLGAGSNVLIGDLGIKGLVIINRACPSSDGVRIKVKNCKSKRAVQIKEHVVLPRLRQLEKGTVNFSDFDYDEGKYPRVEVEVPSSAPLGLLITQLIERGITGLQWFTGIPGTVGGAIYKNIHGGTHFFSEVVNTVKVLEENGRMRKVGVEKCDFDYDQSRFQKSGEIILSAAFSLPLGDVSKAESVIKEWGGWKVKNQPQNSGGSVFMNLDVETQEKLELPTPGWGYIIDKILGLKGKKVGGAKISEMHAGFIVNDKGRAKAKDVLALIEMIKKKSKAKLGIVPDLEIALLGKFKT